MVKKILSIIAILLMLSGTAIAQHPGAGGGSGGTSVDPGGTGYVYCTYAGGACTFTANNTLVLTTGLTVNTGTVTLSGQAGGSSVTLPSSGTLGVVITKAYTSFLAGFMIPDTCSGLLQAKNTNLQFDYLEFKTAAQYANFKWIPPDNWNGGTVKFKATWAAGEAMTNGDTITFGIAAIATADGDSLSQAITTGRITFTDTYVTGDATGPLQKVTEASGALTIDGTPTIAKVINFRFDIDSTNHKKVWLTSLKMEYSLTGTTPTAW